MIVKIDDEVTLRDGTQGIVVGIDGSELRLLASDGDADEWRVRACDEWDVVKAEGFRIRLGEVA